MIRRSLSLALLGLVAFAPGWSFADAVARLDNVVVSSQGVDQPHTDAVARMVQAARAAAVEKYGFDMPARIEVQVRVDKADGNRLFTDGDRTLFLTLKSEDDLKNPSGRGVHLVYGLCHEVGHLAMYRVIAERGWMTTAAAEGWAHYLGSRLVDDVFAREGRNLWPDRHAYENDGTKRLKGQLAKAGDTPLTVRGAGLWQDLVGIVGDKGVGPVFAAWGKATVDPADPAAALGAALGKDERLRRWWAGAGPAFVLKRPASAFAARTAKADELTGTGRELAHDDGTMANKRSIAGGGHGVRFEVAGDGWYLTSVRLHGSRYGTPEAPKEDFTVTLCDENYKRIASFRFPYSSFERGEPRWVTLKVTPTNVPAKFVVCVEFNPTARKGVYVSHDAGGEKRSLSGLPGDRPRPFDAGDWMLRATVDRLKQADALRP
jgi:hypothetical protein